MTDSSSPNEVQWHDVKEGVDIDDVLYEFCDAQNPSCTHYDYLVVYSDDRKKFRFQAITTEEQIKTQLLDKRIFITWNAALGAMLVLLCGEPDPPFVRSGHNRISDRTGTEIDALINGDVFYFTATTHTEHTVWEVRFGDVGQRKRDYWPKTRGHRPVRQETQG